MNKEKISLNQLAKQIIKSFGSPVKFKGFSELKNYTKKKKAIKLIEITKEHSRLFF